MIRFIVFFFITTILISCNPTKVVELEAFPSPQPQPMVAATSSRSQTQLPLATPKNQNHPSPNPLVKPISSVLPVEVFNENIARGKEFLLQQRTNGTTGPQDEIIGPLGNESDKPEAWATVSSFLDSLVAAKSNTTLYSDRWKDFLSRIVSLGLTQSGTIKSWRVGPWINISETTIYAKFFLEGESKCVGLIYLTLEDNKWKINDLQIDFKQIKLKPQVPQETQDPFQFGKSQPMNIY